MEPLNNIGKLYNSLEHQIRSPKMDMYESKETYLIRISIPGVKKEDVKVIFTDDTVLEIKGSVKPIIHQGYDKLVFGEIYQGPFKRTVDLPINTDKSKLSFSYQGGILEVIVSKKVPLGDDQDVK